MEGLDARHALLDRLIDHAPTFPPASLASRDGALARTTALATSPHSFVLARLVWPASRLGEIAGTERGVSAVLDASAPREREIEAVEASISRRPRRAAGLAREVYVEAAGRRTASSRGSTPSPSSVCGRRCGAAEQSFRATRSSRASFAGAGSAGSCSRRPPGSITPCARTASTASSTCSRRWSSRGMRRRRSRRPTRTRLRSDADSFTWREHSADAAELGRVRHELFHSIGSCSFFEPVEELQALGMLPP